MCKLFITGVTNLDAVSQPRGRRNIALSIDIAAKKLSVGYREDKDPEIHDVEKS